jgi:hypothetical protein
MLVLVSLLLSVVETSLLALNMTRPTQVFLITSIGC